MPPSPLSILVDEREKKPVPLPGFHVCWVRGSGPHNPSVQTLRVDSQKVTLPTGDYVLRGYESVCIIERKASWSELSANLCTKVGRTRFLDELRRLKSECAHPVLLLEGTLAPLPSERSPVREEAVRDILIYDLAEYGIPLHTYPTTTHASRIRLGGYICSLLYYYACYHESCHKSLPAILTPATSHLPLLN